MKLIDWLTKEEARGRTVKIGTKGGTGFVICGIVGDELINKAITLPDTAGKGKKGKRSSRTKGDAKPETWDFSNRFFADRKIIEACSAVYCDWLVLIEGDETGKEDLPKELEHKFNPDAVPIERYVDFGNEIVGNAVQSLIDAYVDAIMRPTENARNYAEKEIREGEKFILSDSFKTLAPSADPKRVLELVRDRADGEIIENMIEMCGIDAIEELRKLDRRTISFLQTFEPPVLMALGAGNGQGGQIVRDASDEAIRDARRRYYEKLLQEQKRRDGKRKDANSEEGVLKD